MDPTPDRLSGHAETNALAPSGGPPLIAQDHRDLICALAYVALGVGDHTRAIALLNLVVREVSDDVGALRLLAYAHILADDGEAALATLDHLAREGEPEAAPLLLLRGQALRLTGKLEEGRASFRRFVEIRNVEEAVR